MCGITGFSLKDSSINRKKIIQLMNDKLSHRGPDGEGYYNDDFINFGHKRLAIIDLNERSNQPFVDSTNEFVIVFNGEIYNYIEIKKELIEKGIKFKTTSDTEVLIESYVMWGDNFVSKLKGMFAFAIYDKKKKTILCARDHFGQKPFFYYYNNENFIFSSELTSLISNPIIKKNLSVQSIIDYFHYDSFVGSSTPIKHCFKLEPAQYLKFDIRSKKITINKFWNLDINSKKNSTKNFENEFLEKLKNSSKIHLRSDVPIALYLSGGVDSSTMACMSKKVLNHQNLTAFNLKFKNETFNEHLQASDTAKKLDINIKTFNLEDIDYISHLVGSIDKIDEPLADVGFLAISLISNFVSHEGFKVAISGDGGDELLMGYEPFQKLWLFNLLNKSRFLSNTIKNISKFVPDSFDYMGFGYKVKIFSRSLGHNNDLANSRWITSFLPEEIDKFITQDYKIKNNFDKRQLYNYILDIINNNNSKNAYDILSIQYQKHFLSNLICNHTDKANMQNSIEARSPFLDHELFEYTNSIPHKFKIKKGSSKLVLRKFLKNNLNNNIYKNPKKGFTVPLAHWINNEINDLILDTFNKKRSNELSFLNMDYFKKNILKPHIEGITNNHKKIWNVFILLRWIDNNISK